jgi:acyl dehydratase
MQHTTMDRAGRLVSVTDYGSLYRGVDLHGAEAAAPGAVSRGGTPLEPVRWEEAVVVSALAAHVYTEGARIYNPIHTDIAVARAAGLPGLILHGTATLALAVSRVVARDLGGNPTRVRGVAARFAGMVTMPSTFVVRGRRRDGDRLEFDAVSPAGAPVLTEAAVTA